MKHIKIHPIKESSCHGGICFSESNYNTELRWEEKFLHSEACKKIIEDLNDALVSLSDERNIVIEPQIYESPLINIYCELKSNADLNYSVENPIDNIRDFELYSKEIIDIGYAIEEGIKRSKIEYVNFTICKVSLAEFEYPSLLYAIEIDKKSYPLND